MSVGLLAAFCTCCVVSVCILLCIIAFWIVRAKKFSIDGLTNVRNYVQKCFTEQKYSVRPVFNTDLSSTF